MAAALVQLSDAEECVQALKTFELNEIGSKSWFDQHKTLEKLNMQAAKSVASAQDELVKEYMVNYKKTPIIIHNLIVTDCWILHLFPAILDKTDSETNCFPLFLVLQNQVTLTGLLETLTYHLDVCIDGEEFLTDLVDFCHRKLIGLINRSSTISAKETNDSSEGKLEPLRCLNKSNQEELEYQAKKTNFQVGIKSVSILCDVIDNLNDLPLGVRSRLLCSHDTPMVLVQLLESPPWIRETRTGSREEHDGCRWTELEDSSKVTKLEGKVWIALFRFIHEPDNARKYDLNDFRTSRLLKLRPLLQPVLLDQMPYLEPLKRTLEELALFKPPFAKKDIVIEQSAVIWESIVQKWEGKWKALAEEQMATVFKCSPEIIQEQAKSLSVLYNFDILEELMLSSSPLPPQSSNKCAGANCGQKSASKRCSRCKSQWYCSKQCQVDDWVNHKETCKSSPAID